MAHGERPQRRSETEPGSGNDPRPRQVINHTCQMPTKRAQADPTAFYPRAAQQASSSSGCRASCL